MNDYSQRIKELVECHPLGIDTNVTVHGRMPVSASSEFLTNKEQGDWAERVVLASINVERSPFWAVPYGRSESLAAGDSGFKDYYLDYLHELNTIGKRPDILIFRRAEYPEKTSLEILSDELVCHAVAAVEVRSSSFISNHYQTFMQQRTSDAENECLHLRDMLLEEPYGSLLLKKKPAIYSMLRAATADTFRDLDFRSVSWSSSESLRTLSKYLGMLKNQIRLLQKRDYLSITPKLEDLALVNRWIQHFGVPHYYLQVFFDSAYLISFEDILRISSDPEGEDVDFSVEKDIKNQGKTTIKIDISHGTCIIDGLAVPSHHSAVKELDRGRLLFYVTFEGSHGVVNTGLLESIWE